ncbi:MAG: carboxypeptidase regulatory-like domain-containing protein, partial [Candidatus Solibacter usitatus]|nr:carboxypeptidase regulatory-like domain-containing protein [Candidatus Solibacter usitatus]
MKSTLSGVITDGTSAAIPGADVKLLNEATGLAVPYKTSADGMYAFPFLETGRYSVQVSSPGFKTLVRSGVTVQSNSDQRLDLTLDVGEISQKVEVAGEAPLLNQVSATVATSVGHEEIENYPLIERNVLQLINLIPGSTLGGTGTQDFDPSINGTRPRGNNFTVDGISINQEHSGTTGGAGVSYSPQVEAVSEFKVLTSNYSAEYGRAMGSIISVGLMSGTNRYHGSLFEFLRNDAFTARSYFLAATARKPKLRNNQLGGSLGGPIKRDKLFFFATGEQLLQHSSNVSTFSVPTKAMLAGDFSTDANTIFDPATVTTGPTGAIVRQPFAGNKIPSARFDPSAIPLAAFWPQPDPGSPDGSYTNASVPGKNSVKFNIKLDYSVSQKDNLSVRISYNYAETIGATAVPGPGN